MVYYQIPDRQDGRKRGGLKELVLLISSMRSLSTAPFDLHIQHLTIGHIDENN